MLIKIDGCKAETRDNFLYRGQGMISCNGSSCLLLDYKEKAYESYIAILNHLYGKHGLQFTHFKLELGADVNTSSGTEPATMRCEDENADVRRGAGFQIAADIKKINPNVTLDMLWWSEPRWVSDAKDVYAARYRWYKLTLDAAYETYGLIFDYVSANRNEREVDIEWIIYLSQALKRETNCPYDYSKIKIVAADECGTWSISKAMSANKELCDAVDVIGSHYTSFADNITKELAEKKGKEIWFSEGSSPMTYAQAVHGYDEGNSGLTGLNGVLDIANRLISMISGGYMTLYEYQPAVAAYYDGVTYCQKQLISANTPWNGYYELDSGYYMNLHFSQFFDKGWRFIFDACHADGVAGGDGHSLVDATYTFMTACSDAGDYSTIITNTTDQPITYAFEVENLLKADDKVCVFETRGPENNQRYDANYFKKVGSIIPENRKFCVTVKPYSMVTVSTVDITDMSFDAPPRKANTILPLPYAENFAYSDDFLLARGNAPLYTTDEGGAFEVSVKNGKKVLMQKITPGIKANEWGATPEPTTNFGDDRWYNYSMCADVLTDGANSYAGIGVRYILADNGRSGYGFILGNDGSWQFIKNQDTIESGALANYDCTSWHNIKLSAFYENISAFIDGEKVLDYTEKGGGFAAGRAALYSSYNHCCFDNILIESTDVAKYFVKKYDNLDSIFAYSADGWEHKTMDGFRNYKRTLSTGSIGAVAEIKFHGAGVVLTGANCSDCVIEVELDGTVIHKKYVVPHTTNRQSIVVLKEMEDGNHSLKFTVLSGKISIDSAQILLNKSIDLITLNE